jgi:uncharacterized membrane protein
MRILYHEGAAMATPPDPCALPPTPERVAALLAAGVLDERGHAAAMRLIGRRPGPSAWLRFLRVRLLFLGVAALATGAALFVAASWERLGALLRIGLVALPLAAAAAGAARAGLDRLAGRAAALLAALLVGPLLALLGQSYPTGADLFDLFAAWALANAAFALATREPALLVVEAALLDLAIGAWEGEVRGRDLWRDESLGAFALVQALHAAGALAWEALAARGAAGVSGRAVPRALAVSALALAVTYAIPLLAGDRSGDHTVIAAAALVASLAWVAALVAAHRRLVPDLLMLAAAGAGGALLLAVLAGRLLFKELDADVGGFFVLGALLIGEMTALGLWLNAWRRRHDEAVGAPRGAAPRGGAT